MSEIISDGGYLSEREANKLYTKVGGRSLCCNCMYWLELEPPGWLCHSSGAVEWEGSCRRHSPTYTDTEENNHYGIWPVTNYSNWCGDFERTAQFDPHTPVH